MGKVISVEPSRSDPGKLFAKISVLNDVSDAYDWSKEMISTYIQHVTDDRDNHMSKTTLADIYQNFGDNVDDEDHEEVQVPFLQVMRAPGPF